MTESVQAPAARASAALFTVLAGFQAALAAGAPWGAAAWGGTHPGVLPAGYRVASGVGALVWLSVAVLLVRPGTSPTVRLRTVRVLLPLMVVSGLLNAASRSGVERAVWTPFAVVQLALLWRLHRSLTAAPVRPGR